jgi:tetratricopeptide (TPR) repeat protein
VYLDDEPSILKMTRSNITIAESYELFGLNPSSWWAQPLKMRIEEIKSIYRQMAKEIHPDLNPNDATALDRFTILNQAYQLLLEAAQSDTDSKIDTAPNPESNSKIRVDYVIDRPLCAEDLQLKQEVFESLEKLIRQGNFKQAVSTIDLLVRVIPDRPEISKKQSEIYFQYAQDLVKQRSQLNLARTFLKESLRIDPHNRQHWQAVNREFNRIERLTI